jgi:hypothetical protein
MVFLDKPHIKQFTDIFDTSIKNLFIFKIYIYYYFVSLYNLGIHYLTYKNDVIYNLFNNGWFLLSNMIIAIFSFIIIVLNYYMYPKNKISNTIFSFTSSNTFISLSNRMYSHLFIISFEILTNIILLSIVIYTINNKKDNFIINKLYIILCPLYFSALLLIKYFDTLTNRQFVYLLIYSVIILILHFQNIRVILKRYMQNDLYLAYLNIYFILIDIINIIFLDIIVEIFFPKNKYKK